MKKIKIKKTKEKNLIGKRFKYYIGIAVFACCLVIAKNMTTNTNLTKNDKTINSEMVYIFHDYQGNQHILNNTQHGAADSYEYLFDSEVPEEVKQMTNSVSLAGRDVDSSESDNENTLVIHINEDQINIVSGKDSEISKSEDKEQNEDLKDNQLSIDDILRELNIDNYDTSLNDRNESELTISLTGDGNIEGNSEENDNEDIYYIQESDDGSILVIQNAKYWNSADINAILYSTNDFSQIVDSIFIPTLIPRDQLDLSGNDGINIELIQHQGEKSDHNGGITIIDDYKNCKTPWGYTIVHGDSVLAYQQMEDAPGICNIERRFCRDGKLSGKYTQQGCSTATQSFQNIQQQSDIRYEYDSQPTNTNKTKNGANSRGGTKNTSKSTIAVKPLGTGSFAFDKPSQSFTNNLGPNDNIVNDPEVDQTSRPTWDCVTPRGETVPHGQIVQAFKYANGFNDAPCETQFRLCSMGNLMGTFSESSCKPRDTSFIDWINGSPTRETYSEEKLQWVRKLIEYEQFYDRDYKRFTNSEALDKIMNILDS